MGIESRMQIFPCKASGLRFGVLFPFALNMEDIAIFAETWTGTICILVSIFRGTTPPFQVG